MGLQVAVGNKTAQGAVMVCELWSRGVAPFVLWKGGEERFTEGRQRDGEKKALVHL